MSYNHGPVIRFVTRWALSKGIRKVEGHYVVSGKYFRGDSGCGMFVSASEVFPTLDEAIAKAKVMALKKSERLRAQVDKFGDPNWTPKVCE